VKQVVVAMLLKHSSKTRANKANNIYNFIFLMILNNTYFLIICFLSNIEFKILWPIFNSFRAKVVLLNLWPSINFLSNSTIDLDFFIFAALTKSLYFF